MFSEESHFLEHIESNPGVTIGTLGPPGTSSDFALEKILKKDLTLDWKKVLFGDFDSVYSNLQSGEIDMAMVPAAYTNATDFFWSPEFMLVGSISSPTPNYHFATLDNKETIRSVATIKAVEHLLNKQLSIETSTEMNIVYANSTIDAAYKVIYHQADACLTNDNGLCIGKFKVLRTTPGVNMVWSFFSQKK